MVVGFAGGGIVHLSTSIAEERLDFLTEQLFKFFGVLLLIVDGSSDRINGQLDRLERVVRFVRERRKDSRDVYEERIRWK